MVFSVFSFSLSNASVPTGILNMFNHFVHFQKTKNLYPVIPSYLITNILLFLLFFSHTSRKICLYPLTLSVCLSLILQLTSVWWLLPPHQIQFTNVNPHLMHLPSQWYLSMFIYWYLLLYIHSFLYSSLLIDSWRAY